MGQEEKPTVCLNADESTIRLRLAGVWKWSMKVPAFAGVLPELKALPSLPVVIETSEVTGADSTLSSFLLALDDWAAEQDRTIDWTSIPEDSLSLLDLARVADKKDKVKASAPGGFLASFGQMCREFADGAVEIAAFVGACSEGFLRLLLGREKMRWQEIWLVAQRVGLEALPIVVLINFLVGLIISFLGAVTLRQFGAEFAVAYLVGFGMLREMGAIMTGIIMAGRTGAAFAAEIGSMKVNEELDALRTFGISPLEYLALPRLIAMVLMMPLLVGLANIVGIFGGWLVAEFLMGVPGTVFFTEMKLVVGFPDLALGIFKGFVFGALIAVAGCLRGLQTGSGASAVGLAATRAVVTAITLIIFFNAVIDWAAATLGI